MRARALVAGVMLLATGCATAAVSPDAPAPAAGRSEDFLVVLARQGDTAERLAAQHLGDRSRAWMIEDYMGARTFNAGQQVIIPLRPWNITGVDATGYQIVPILCYHNLGPESKGRLLLGAPQFEQQMRYLKEQGYRVVSMSQFIEWMQLKRQMPMRSVVLTFDDGYKAFKTYAQPILKELGFTATLFVYTDYIGAGRNALSWDELKTLAAEGVDVQAHSKSHGNLRRAQGENDQQYSRRMEAELSEPLKQFQRNLGRPVTLLAYPYGSTDDGVVAKVKEYGYMAAFTVRRQGSPVFVQTFRVNRSQVYSEMSLEEFAKNLNVFHQEDLR